MEKRKLILSAILFLFQFSLAYSQSVSLLRKIRIPLWAELDAYPELEEAQNTNSGQFDYPINRIKKVAPYLITGMVYGWKFDYTPSDKLRGVSEYFELEPIQELSESEKISYDSPLIADNRLSVWCEFTRSEYQIKDYQMWNSIKNPVIQGRGYGKLSSGFDGITEAAENAVKNGVRDYLREIIKNKPKEITGRILIKQEPLIGIDEGQYLINLAFFLECDRIVNYEIY